MRAAELPPWLGWLREQGFATLVWDGAPSHRDATVRRRGLPLIGLPPYSPELNPAERVFEGVRRQVEGVLYATLDEKVAAVTTFLEALDADPDRSAGCAGGPGSADCSSRLRGQPGSEEPAQWPQA